MKTNTLIFALFLSVQLVAQKTSYQPVKPISNPFDFKSLKQQSSELENKYNVPPVETIDPYADPLFDKRQLSHIAFQNISLEKPSLVGKAGKYNNAIYRKRLNDLRLTMLQDFHD